MPTKPKTNQPETKNSVQGRDLFQTPNYAVDLLVPFIPKSIDYIWECAAGERKISNRMVYFGYMVWSSDIRESIFVQKLNFLTESKSQESLRNFAIVTNPPFSLKYKFINRAIQYDIPFAFLIPFDMCLKMASLFTDYGCQGIVPTRRIDYITPTGKSGATGHTSYYHSFWLTRYFNLRDMLTFVELTNEQKKENI
jgi:hypothetical protein